MVQGRTNSHSALSAQYRQYHSCLSVPPQAVEPLDHHPRTVGVQSSARVCLFLPYPACSTSDASARSTWLLIPQTLIISVNPAADALRAAILAVGAVHLRFTHDSSDQKGAWAIVRASKAKVLSLVRRSIDSQQATNTPMDKGDVEMILAALLSCTIASVCTAHVYRCYSRE